MNTKWTFWPDEDRLKKHITIVQGWATPYMPEVLARLNAHNALVAALRSSCDALERALTWIWSHDDPDGEDAYRSLSAELARSRAALAAMEKQLRIAASAP